ncbi:MAG: transglycosylase domain-containing protein [Clostridia bacterium]|nr:transglycosylase domain-containing protein [Clostridia bacterium]
MKNAKTDKNLDFEVKKHSKKHQIIVALLVVFVIMPIIIAGLTIAAFAIYASTVNVDASLLPTASAVPTFYDVNGNKLAYAEDAFLSPDEIPDNLKYAFVATEDKRFYEHKGVDVVRIGGAIVSNIKNGKVVEGASTITQQLVKNTHLSHERTLSRKLKEIAIASNLEKEYSKDEILAMYLSVIYFGNGIYGAKQAAKYYFQKDVKDLSVAESATLAAIVKNPSKYSPNKDKSAAKSRRNSIIDKMCEQNYIPLDAANIEKSKDLNIISNDDITSANTLHDSDVKIFFDSAIQEVCEALNITKYQLFNSGYKIHTTFDQNIQKIAVQSLKDKSLHDENVEGLVVIIDNERGGILAYSSTLGYTPKRQLGSTIKPILYSAALDKNILTLATPVVDEEINYGGYAPKNFADKYYGHTLVKEAIKKSMNSVAVKTCDYIGIDTYFDYVKKFGLTLDDDDKNYSLSLGATKNGISPLEIASAYTVFANDGTKKQTHFVRFIEKNGTKIYSSIQNGEQIVKSSTAQLVNVALVDTVKDGTAKTLSALPFEIAAKTGTVEHSDGKNTDAWCASYTPNYTIVVWHGSDEGMNEKGGGLPTKQCLSIWQNVYTSSNTAAFEKEFAKDKIKPVEVDLYSTFNTNQIIASNKNTPLEYRYIEYFADNSTFDEGSFFDEVPAADFEVETINGVCTITYVPKHIYEYDLIIRDLFGTRTIKHISSETHTFDGDFNALIEQDEQITINDCPISFGGAVEYALVAYLKDNPEIKNVSTKRVFVDTHDFHLKS